MRVIKVKHTYETSHVYGGQTIANGEYYTIQNEYERIAFDADQSLHVDMVATPAKAIVNDGNSDLDWEAGQKWLAGNIEPPKTADGDWHVTSENFAHVTGNEGINWNTEMTLEAGQSYEERFVVPDGRVVTLDFMNGNSASVSAVVHLCWFEEISTDVYMRRNPWIRVDEVYCLVVDGAHDTSDTVISVINTNDELDTVKTDKYYGFKDGSNDTFYRKITAVDTDNDTVTISSGLPNDIADATKIGMTDRTIGEVSINSGTDVINWLSPPTDFVGNDKNYFRLKLENSDAENTGEIAAVVNGWHTDATSGD